MNTKNTIQDFGTQWQAFQRQDGVYASEAFFQNYFGPLLDLSELKGKKVAEVGSGNGRFLNILATRVASVTGFEPSDAFFVAREYCKGVSNIELSQTSIYDVHDRDRFEAVFCIGVLHHLPDPLTALQIMKGMLKPQGSLYVWVYGKENNGLYLALFQPLMKITSKLPHPILLGVSHILAVILRIYLSLVFLLRFFPWPLKEYCLNILRPLPHYYIVLNVYDQLNPRIAHYYTKDEIETLFRKAGFLHIETYHRYAYSWSIKARKA